LRTSPSVLVGAKLPALSSSRLPVKSGARLPWACPGVLAMLLTNKTVSGATLLAVASLLVGLMLPTGSASAANLELPVSVLSSAVGSTTLSVSLEAMQSQVASSSYAFKLPVTYEGYSDYGPFAPESCAGYSYGGTASFQLVENFVISSANHQGNCSTSGVYYMVFATFEPTDLYDCTGKDCFYAPYYWNAETQQAYSTTGDYNINFQYNNILDNLNTRFLQVSLTDGTGNDAVNFSIDYFIDESEYDPNTASRNPTLISIEYAKRPATTFSKLGYSILPIGFSTSTKTGTITGLSNGTFDLLIRFSNAGVAFGGDVPFSQSYVYTSIVISGGQLTSVGALEFYDGRKQSTLGTIVYKDCSLTQFDNCITNAFLYLFAPSTETLSSFSDLGENIQTRFPFVYAYQFSEIFTSMFDTTQNQSLSIVIPFAEAGNLELISEEMLSAVPFSSLIRTILASIMWLLFMLTVYRNTLRIYDNTAV